jgi:shikimate kinase
MAAGTDSGRPLLLAGFMGAGKSTVGPLVAAALGRRFVDLDEVVAAEAGATVAQIFEREGEAGFRARERETIEALTALEPIVMATGGGAILDAENRRMLAEHGTVIYLETSLGQQLQRVGSGRGRPLLKGGDLAERLKTLREVRDPLYLELADHIVPTDHRRVQKVAESILQIVRGPDAAVPESGDA